MTPLPSILHLSTGTKSQPLNNFLKPPKSKKKKKKEYEYICICLYNEQIHSDFVLQCRFLT